MEDFCMKKTELNLTKKGRSLVASILAVTVVAASFTGCKTGTEQTDGMRDGDDINTVATTTETEPVATPTPTNTPTPTPSPTPAIPHMNKPEKDTTAPMFLNLPEKVSIEVGSEFDINRHIGFIDDCDSDVECIVEGDIDTSETGTYSIEITLVDDAGNTKSGSMDVRVYQPSSGGGGGGGGSDEHTTLAYSDFMDRYPDPDIAYGIDVSRYQGDINFEKIKAAGCEYVIIGHSERRQYFGETDKTVNLRTVAAVKAGLKAIVCVGEMKDEREAGYTDMIVTYQTQMALHTLTAAELENVVVAYEPVWAIGTGLTATDEQANETIGVIRKAIAAKFGEEAAAKIRIQYGGSMKGSNVKGLMAQPEIDGGLIGGASLKAEDFAQVVNF